MENNPQLYNIRHSLAHVLASSVLEMFPDAKLGVGPVIETGFYYDFLLPRSVTPEDLKALEKRMKHLVKQNLGFERQELGFSEAKEFFEKRNQPFKIELISDLENFGTTKVTDLPGTNHNPSASAPNPDSVSLYTTGEFIDLCRGGHVENTKEINPDSFTLDKVAGAYWRGDQANPQLQRIYGFAFENKEQLDQHLKFIEEAGKRDHKKIGKALNLFTFSSSVGSGLPLFLPKGNLIRTALLDYITELKLKRDYKFVWTPHLAKEELYIKSGHLGKYDAMLPSINTDDGDKFVMKPMNCPHHFEIYNAEPHSYRDLPYRIAENATVYRNEKSGELNGLFRVRSLTQDDTHHVIRADQIQSEIDMILELTKEVYDVFDFKNYKVEISARDSKHPENYFGDDTLWNSAQEALIEGAKRWGAPYTVVEGEAAFYGPKIDIKVEDAIGRTWQLTTVQLDYNQPKNFEMSYTGQDGTAQTPVVLHVAILGSLDRFMGIMIEHFSGSFPLWLSPVQIAILPISDKHIEYASQVKQELINNGLRVELDERSESIGKKIREATTARTTYMLVIGDKEMESQQVAIRNLAGEDLGTKSLKDLMDFLNEEVQNKKSN